MVVLCPTELGHACRPLGLHSAIFHVGVPYGPQAGALRRGLDVAVGTPGRVMNLLDQGNLDLRECQVVVLDEANEMLNMGFAGDVKKMLDGAGSGNAEKMQCLLFSATTPP
jgi:superfamily II DNA/RNA helicase